MAGWAGLAAPSADGSIVQCILPMQPPDLPTLAGAGATLGEAFRPGMAPPAPLPACALVVYLDGFERSQMDGAVGGAGWAAVVVRNGARDGGEYDP